MDEQKKIMVLHYSEPDGTATQLHGVCKRIIPSEQEMQLNGYICGPPKIKEFLNGKIKMFYSDISSVPNIKVNGVIYYGPVVFMAFDDERQPVNISDKQIKAIKLVINKLW